MERKIMLLEDDPAVNEAVCLVLMKSGFAVETFLQPDECKDFTRNPPNVYIIDKNLKGFDGLDVCRQLKAAPETRGIPVIIISASSHVEEAARRSGADEFLEKPFSTTELLTVVNRCLPAGSFAH